MTAETDASHHGHMKIGILGAGNIGSQIARLAVANGHDVVISNSRGPETLPAELFAELRERLVGATARVAAEAGEIVVVAGGQSTVAIGFFIGAAVMAIGGAAELFFGVRAERLPLENIAKPLTVVDAEPAVALGGQQT